MEVSNAELILLEIIYEKGPISGYSIGKLVAERGYREWADIGSTSIYRGLSNLESGGMLVSENDNSKNGKGPMPRIFKISRAGLEMLAGSVASALAESGESDKRFDIGVAGMAAVGFSPASTLLKRRVRLLSGRKEYVSARYREETKNKVPFFVKALFEHPLAAIESEIEFTQRLIAVVSEEARRERKKKKI